VREGPSSIYATSRFSPYSIRNEQTPQDAYNHVVQDVGANRPVRDSVDQRIVNNLVNRTGQFLNGSDVVWPNLASATVPADADEDGMPDAWEQQQFGTTSRGSATNSSSDFDGDGSVCPLGWTTPPSGHTYRLGVYDERRSVAPMSQRLRPSPLPSRGRLRLR
jgi:hypothetical protein